MTHQVHTHAPDSPDASEDDWRHRAACVDFDADIWFADGKSRDEAALTEFAKAVCARCPSRVPCGRWALERPYPVAGVWGGLTEDDRKSLKRKAARERARAAP